MQDQLRAAENLPTEGLPYFLITGKETNASYTSSKNEIRILLKSGEIVPMSQLSDTVVQPQMFTKYYLCYPKMGETSWVGEFSWIGCIS